MLMRKSWRTYDKCGICKYEYWGYFLLGFIPLYIERRRIN